MLERFQTSHLNFTARLHISWPTTALFQQTSHLSCNMSADEKNGTAIHLEDGVDDDVKVARQQHEVQDSAARGYVDETVKLTPQQDKELFWKINRRVLPFLMLAYFLQSIDKSATGMSLIMGWQKDVGSKGNDIPNVASLYWAGYLCAEPFAAQVVRRFPVAKCLGGG